ncbi:MAG: tetratricopeptide repeat protein, partial [Candidatus Zixiibacteriota bacterium]
MRNKIAYHKLEIAQRNGVKSPNPLRKLACSTTAVLALSAMTLLGGCGQEPLPAGQAQFARGLELLHSGKIERADEEFAAASEVDPARPWRELGGVRKIEAYSLSLGALREYESMINLAPDFDSGYTGFCRVALRNGKTHLAKIIAQKYADQLGLDYSQAPALTESSGATGATGATGASGATGTVAAISAAERSFHLIYARVEIQNGEYARAERRLRGLLTTLPDDDEVRLALASALAAQSKMALALAEAEEALRGSGDNRAVLINGVDFYIDANQADS